MATTHRNHEKLLKGSDPPTIVAKWPKEYTALGYSCELQGHLHLYAIYKDDVCVKSCLGTVGDAVRWVKTQFKNKTIH
jgi:hypothetical protein